MNFSYFLIALQKFILFFFYEILRHVEKVNRKIFGFGSHEEIKYNKFDKKRSDKKSVG